MNVLGNYKIFKGREIPFSIRLVKGAIGKEFVVKHYGKKCVITKYPDMTDIIPTRQQRSRRDLFREAVAYAKTVIANPVLKEAMQKKIRRRNGVYNESIKIYMLKEKREKERAELQTERLLDKALNAALKTRSRTPLPEEGRLAETGVRSI